MKTIKGIYFCDRCNRVLDAPEVLDLGLGNETVPAIADFKFTTCCMKGTTLTKARPPRPGERCLRFHSSTDAQQTDSETDCRNCGVLRKDHPALCEKCEVVIEGYSATPHNCLDVLRALRAENVRLVELRRHVMAILASLNEVVTRASTRSEAITLPAAQSIALQIQNAIDIAAPR